METQIERETEEGADKMGEELDWIKNKYEQD